MIKEPKYYQDFEEMSLAEVNYQLKYFYNEHLKLEEKLINQIKDNKALKKQNKLLKKQSQEYTTTVNKFLENKNKRIVTTELIARVKELRNSGMTIKTISRKTDISTSTVSKILNNYYDILS